MMSTKGMQYKSVVLIHEYTIIKRTLTGRLRPRSTKRKSLSARRISLSNVNVENVPRERGSHVCFPSDKPLHWASPDAYMEHRVSHRRGAFSALKLVWSQSQLFPGNLLLHSRKSLYLIQSGASGHSLGLEDKNLGSSPGLLGQQVATVAAHQPGGTPQIFIFKTQRMTGHPALYIEFR